ncbi:tropomyosin-2 [Coemansia thaxteri]|uniref:Tropomyosin-2 n=1 Tax=Coemansia thaxteri TaxID=2663907 RepID=A0A9W8EF20_9FUNG|nr:tropomyosin-2 [Coemansia thaxteri]KAJ2009359.1 tropomyosin-2 [Coemansia thaxteri]KAJ2474008.1 tropomyosin-2 [Coemansia sp. RSA 2322]KAJ2487317.1 tropomyosin-2 [Coemansia sp. RSA 2320]
MDKFREKLQTLRAEAEVANERADAAEYALKQLNDQQTEREQEFISLQNRIALLEAEADRRDTQLTEAKQIQKDSEATLNQSDVLVKKVDTLEEKLEKAENQLREALDDVRKLDLENEKLQRCITQHEKDKEAHEARYDELNDKYVTIKSELEETMRTLDEI